jgi:hypothetical protein
MRIFFLLLMISCSFKGISQCTYTQFPGSGFGLILPDSNYRYTTRGIFGNFGFYNDKTDAFFLLVNLHTDPDIDTSAYRDMIKMKSKDSANFYKGIVFEKIVLPDSGWIFKSNLGADSSQPLDNDNKPMSAWIYFYNYRGFHLLLIGGYDLKNDSALHDPFVRSLESLRPVDTLLAENFFKKGFTITDDYAPLKYAGKKFGGTLLNMEGKEDITGKDSSYCLIFPVDIIFTVTSPDNARSYLKKRLQLHEKNEVHTGAFGKSISGPYRTYYMTAETIDGRILYFCIKTDPRGYFEIWGEAYHNNKKLIDVFEKISSSLWRE